MAIELRDLRWAIAASHHRSLRKAAESLNVRQSTLSRNLRTLELDLGATIFERTNGGTRPTSEGQEFLEAARRIVEDAETIQAHFKLRTRGDNGRVAVGVHTSLSTGNLRATLAEYHRRFPLVETHLVDGSSDHLFSDLGNTALDIAFVAEGSGRWDGRSLPVWSERIVVALPEDHPLSSNTSVRWDDLKKEPLVLPQRGPGPEFLQLLERKLGCPRRLTLRRHDVSLDRLLTLVSVGCGVMLALEGATGVIYPGITFREVHDDYGTTRLQFRAYWRGTNTNPPLRSLINLLRDRYQNLCIAAD